MHPQNIGISLFLFLLYLILPHSFMVPKMVNVIFSTLTSFMIFLLYKELNKNRKRNEYGLLVLSCLFLPSVFMNNIVYNDVISTSLLICAVFFAIKYVRCGKCVYWFLFSAFLSIGNYFRSIGMIFLVAIAFYILFNTRNIKNTAAALLMTVLVFMMPSFAINKMIEYKGNLTEPIGKNSAPVLMWINMGMCRDTLGFWDGGKSYDIYFRSDWNKEASQKLYIEEIRNNIQTQPVMNLLSHYSVKTFWVWTEGTYQYELYGLGYHSLGGYMYNTPANQFLDDQFPYRENIRWIVYVFNFVMYCLIAVSVLVSIREGDFKEELLLLIILGFIAFYILWEIKSRYLYPCFPYILILSYTGMRRIIDALYKIKDQYF
ncbi:MAG: glycosyltransferase family 39 protein [Clostridiales bacterium]|nr:glycosyltransferase family 39 protein [Eubacteriales bacterium]MDH7564870.1 glycosyltransferase family 39 protein [Clostridiales bacterium]